MDTLNNMNISPFGVIAAALLLASSGLAQAPKATTNPFPEPIPAAEGVIQVQFTEFASLPDSPGQGSLTRMMLMIDEPGTRRMFVNDMRGPLYSVSYDGKTVTQYIDINAPNWGVKVQSARQ